MCEESVSRNFMSEACAFIAEKCKEFNRSATEILLVNSKVSILLSPKHFICHSIRQNYFVYSWAGYLSRYSDRRRTGRYGIESQWGRDFPPVQTGSGHGRVELYLYPPSGPPRACNGITLPLRYVFRRYSFQILALIPTVWLMIFVLLVSHCRQSWWWYPRRLSRH